MEAVRDKSSAMAVVAHLVHRDDARMHQATRQNVHRLTPVNTGQLRKVVCR